MRMQSYQPYWAAKGHLLARAGNAPAAAHAFIAASGLSTDDAAKKYLEEQLRPLRH